MPSGQKPTDTTTAVAAPASADAILLLQLPPLTITIFH